MLNRLTASLLALVVLLPPLLRAETAWVTDRFEITLRSGPSTANEIRRMLESGTSLEVLERDEAAGYARVRTAGGTEGWVLTRYLMDERPAREQLARVATAVAPSAAGTASTQTQRQVILANFEDAQQRIAALEAEKARLQDTLAELRRLSADTVEINERNRQLSSQLANLNSQLDAVRERNAVLQRASQRQWFLHGAGVLAGGILLGLILPRLRRRRDHGYGRL